MSHLELVLAKCFWMDENLPNIASTERMAFSVDISLYSSYTISVNPMVLWTILPFKYSLYSSIIGSSWGEAHSEVCLVPSPCVAVQHRSSCAWHLGQGYITQSEVIIWLWLLNLLIILDQMLLSDSIIWFIWFGILEWSDWLDKYQVSALYWPVWMVSCANWTPHPDFFILQHRDGLL